MTFRHLRFNPGQGRSQDVEMQRSWPYKRYHPGILLKPGVPQYFGAEHFGTH